MFSFFVILIFLRFFNTTHCIRVCAIGCTPQYTDSICARSAQTNKFRTFKDDCDLIRTQCDLPQDRWIPIYHKQCNETICRLLCSPNWFKQICAELHNNGGTEEFILFSNFCLFQLEQQCKQQNLTQRTLNECKKPQPTTGSKYKLRYRSCVTICGKVRNQIWGNNSKNKFRVFINKCELNWENCENPKNDWKIIKVGMY